MEGVEEERYERRERLMLYALEDCVNEVRLRLHSPS